MSELLDVGAVILQKYNVFMNKSRKSKPHWEHQLEMQAKELNLDYSEIKVLCENKIVKRKHTHRLERKYRLTQKGKIRQIMETKEDAPIQKRNKTNQYNQKLHLSNLPLLNNPCKHIMACIRIL